MNVKTLSAVLVGATTIGLSMGVAPAKAATFLSNAVQADYLSPDTGTVAGALGTKTIDLDGETFNAFSTVDALVTSTNITITPTPSPGLISVSFNSVPFNGFRFFDVNSTINDIIGVTLGSSTFSGFDLSRVTFDANSVFINLQGLLLTPADAISVDVQFAGDPTPIPTPALLPGLVGLGVAAFRKRQAEQSTEEA